MVNCQYLVYYVGAVVTVIVYVDFALTGEEMEQCQTTILDYAVAILRTVFVKMDQAYSNEMQINVFSFHHQRRGIVTINCCCCRSLLVLTAVAALH